uniref:hypothetical protein n=1 Tax=Streptomyces sp. NRRL F-2664 TaxID=1463842 RepID=UPI001F1BA6E7
PGKDRRSIAHTVTRTADSAGRLAAREQTSFTYDKYGQTASQTVSWAEPWRPAPTPKPPPPA